MRINILVISMLSRFIVDVFTWCVNFLNKIFKMKKLKSVITLIFICSSMINYAQYAELHLSNCNLIAEIVDYNKSQYLAESNMLLCFLEKEVATNVWSKHKGLLSATYVNTIDISTLPLGKYRISYVMQPNVINKKTIISDSNTRSREKELAEASIWISNTITITESNKVFCDNVNISTDIECFPNPTSGVLNIVTTNVQFPLNLSISTLTGKTVFSQTYNKNIELIKINTESFVSGVYWLSSISQDGRKKSSQRIIVL